MQVVGNNGGRGWWEHCLVLENSCCKQIGIGLAGAFGLGQSDSKAFPKGHLTKPPLGTERADEPAYGVRRG